MSARLAAPLALAALLLASPAARAGGEAVTVYKTPTCGCCNAWIEHLEANGFEVTATNLPDLRNLKRENGVPPALSSCHTAFVEGYVVEGHVPASDLRRLLDERPKVAGLAVPGMPIGSPGMEGPNPEPYQVLSFGGAKSVEAFASHPAAEPVGR